MHRINPYLSWKKYLQECYGEALYRVPVDLGYGCPNRGESGGGGCAFCAEDGGRAQQITGVDDPEQQVEKALNFARRRYGVRKYMLYIQAFTGTFADVDRLKSQISGLLEHGRFDALSIGTRPDCIPPEVLQYLQELNRKMDVWIELGVQSTHDVTLERINRGHNWISSEEAVKRVASAGLKPAVHLILGLPGEGPEEWRVSAERIASLPVQAVKLHNLHIIKGTQLAREFTFSPFALLNEHTYAQAVIEVLRRIPSDIPLMRLTTDTPEDKLVAPLWSMSKGEFSEYLVERMCFQGVRQGDLCSNAGTQPRLVHRSPEVEGGSGVGPSAKDTWSSVQFVPLPTDDGSITFWSEGFKEHFHSKVGAVTEAVSKFVEPSGLGKRLKEGDVSLLDICYGLGCNALAACEVAEVEHSCRLNVTAVEIDINVIRSAAEMVVAPEGSVLNWRGINREIAGNNVWTGDCSSIRLLHGDARDKLEEAEKSGPFDIVFLDAFSTQRNAELWTVDFFRRIRALMSEKGVLLTYCAALPVRSGLMQAGFFVGETSPVGRKRGGTIAALRPEDVRLPLSAEELDLIRNSKRGIPYRDPDQVWSSRRILREREMERMSG